MYSQLYNIALHSYALAARLAAKRSPKICEMLRGQQECLNSLADIRKDKAPQGFDYWFHAASLGEFEQARPLIEAIKKAQPETTILLSFFSPSGYKVRHSWPGADAVVYLPFDTPERVRTFLEAAAPAHAVFVKYEFWANYIGELHRRKIPIYIISAIFRQSQRFFKPWGGFWRKVLGNFDHIFVQDENSVRLLDSIGLSHKSTIAGDTRFDRVAEIKSAAKPLPEIARFTNGAAFTFIAGSSWPADEKNYIPWLQSHPEVKAIIAPHEFDEHRIELLCEKLGKDHAISLSQFRANPGKAANARYLIVDCFGLLSSIYR
ncbi:MAG: 3-deoxy-D-manno-octulosonic acid transferase, partial [Muribaculaceae bacterium]|nr:3-deoxy-D-manno-octulosonic acid transferase [Muribaculaceae bacterium]